MRVEKRGDAGGRGLRDLINVIEVSFWLFVLVPKVFAGRRVFIVLAQPVAGLTRSLRHIRYNQIASLKIIQWPGQWRSYGPSLGLIGNKQFASARTGKNSDRLLSLVSSIGLTCHFNSKLDGT